eukprot:2363147-Amphidinium_carterae.1
MEVMRVLLSCQKQSPAANFPTGMRCSTCVEVHSHEAMLHRDPHRFPALFALSGGTRLYQLLRTSLARLVIQELSLIHISEPTRPRLI